ncbi:hypothetical protein [Desulfoscipio geothermicus]|uniref:Uncharacterized protein n=1 Tax=Desulfoscipio geothermicus DSM 3669 TaxID=1121426 RepID=A0A1I6E3M2_9FIRM|nr:hypothetical protein [Desulfoscipio geothermicus]SFR12323.1 hypothetical protein SAMN05660706_1256 [Desulfoscipio geothermicus DSM 3669]
MQISDALAKLKENPLLNPKKIVPDFSMRRELYAHPEYEKIIAARREIKRARKRISYRTKRSRQIKQLVAEQKQIEKDITTIPEEEKQPLAAADVMHADARQGGKTNCYYTAETQALDHDAAYVVKRHNLGLVKDRILEATKRIIQEVIQEIQPAFRKVAANYIRAKFGYAPGEKVQTVFKEEPHNPKRFKEIDIFASDDRYIDPEIEKLMHGSRSRGEVEGWQRASQAGLVNPVTGKLECSFA